MKKVKIRNIDNEEKEILVSLGFVVSEDEIILPVGWNYVQKLDIMIINDQAKNKRVTFIKNKDFANGTIFIHRRLDISLFETKKHEAGLEVWIKDMNNTFEKYIGTISEDRTKRSLEIKVLVKDAIYFLDENFPLWKAHDSYWQVNNLNELVRDENEQKKIYKVNRKSLI